ncbi:hypothetical protein, partial [Ferrimicrobium sp.]|uniref:hypothetical protein n=1 Tax=Ferrimicrobium sp. TaxID=2926050 RepID=UPI0026332C41
SGDGSPKHYLPLDGSISRPERIALDSAQTLIEPLSLSVFSEVSGVPGPPPKGIRPSCPNYLG